MRILDMTLYLCWSQCTNTSLIITYPGSKTKVYSDREDSCETLKEPL